MKCDLLSQVGQVNFLSGLSTLNLLRGKKTFERQAYVCDGKENLSRDPAAHFCLGIDLTVASRTKYGGAGPLSAPGPASGPHRHVFDTPIPRAIIHVVYEIESSSSSSNCEKFTALG